MLKGVNKKVVEVVEIENEYFERAILFIKAEKQDRDERTLRQRAGDYLATIRYTPRRPAVLVRFAFWTLRMGAVAALGGLAAGLLLR